MRWTEALLRAVAYATALVVARNLLWDMLDGGSRATTPILVRAMATGGLLPYAAAAALRRVVRVDLGLGEARLVLAGWTGHQEIQRNALSGLRAWRLPLPGPGFRLLLGGGRARDLLLPSEVARALGATGADPLERFALARTAPSPRSRAFKFGLFPLLPALVVFRAYQVIGFGGLWGEYDRYGLGRWMQSLLLHWAAAVALLALWAALWRIAAEVASLAGALASQRGAVIVRRCAEIAAAVAYYAGVPAVLATMFLR